MQIKTLWRPLQGCTPSKKLLHNQGILATADIYCDICQLMVEDTEHAIILCYFATACLNNFQHTGEFRFISNSLVDFMQHLSNDQVEIEERAMFAYAAWSILGAWNDKFFQNVHTIPVQLMSRLSYFLTSTQASLVTLFR